jgi:hypothetical protein
MASIPIDYGSLSFKLERYGKKIQGQKNRQLPATSHRPFFAADFLP